MTSTVWKLDAHTQAKHQILRKYLNAWLPIISKYNGRVVFFDGFAGPGVYEDGEDGSPVIALKALIEHNHKQKISSEVKFYFIEEDKKRAEKLEKAIEPLREKLPPKAEATVHCGAYADTLSAIFDHLEQSNSTLAPSLVFIDPFGIKGIPLSLVRRIMSFQKCEVLINFMRNFAHRFISAPEFEPHLDEVYGTKSWRKARDFSGPSRLQFLLDLYLKQLRDGGAKYVHSFAMANDKDVLIYDLIFASNHAIGIDRFKDALWSVDGGGGVRFSDAVDPSQSQLFVSLEGHDEALVRMLCERFKSQTVRWPVVEEAIRSSPFRIRKSALKSAAKGPNARITISTDNAALAPFSEISFS